jgi:protein-S-isoprenylcysteine O-methyltransferase Ste14
MTKLNFLGIGPKIAVVLLPWLGTSIALSSINIKFLKYNSETSDILLIAGIVLMAVGLIFYFSTVRMLLKGLKETRLMTTGPYSLCQNPLYASLILVIIPALSLILNSWLVLTTTIIGYILFKFFIKIEYTELEKFFGADYLQYKKETPEFFPFAFKKWAMRG